MTTTNETIQVLLELFTSHVKMNLKVKTRIRFHEIKYILMESLRGIDFQRKTNVASLDGGKIWNPDDSDCGE